LKDFLAEKRLHKSNYARIFPQENLSNLSLIWAPKEEVIV